MCDQSYRPDGEIVCNADKEEYEDYYDYDYDDEQECVEDANTAIAVSSDGSNPMITT